MGDHWPNVMLKWLLASRYIVACFVRPSDKYTLKTICLNIQWCLQNISGLHIVEWVQGMAEYDFIGNVIEIKPAFMCALRLFSAAVFAEQGNCPYLLSLGGWHLSLSASVTSRTFYQLYLFSWEKELSLLLELREGFGKEHHQNVIPYLWLGGGTHLISADVI